MATIQFPLPIHLAPHEEFLDSGNFGVKYYWLTSHRLILSEGPLLLIPLSAIGALTIARRTFPLRLALGLFFAALTIALGVWTRRLFSYGGSPNGLVLGTAVAGLIALVLLFSSAGYRMARIDGLGGVPLAFARVGGWRQTDIEHVLAQISDAIAQFPHLGAVQGAAEARQFPGTPTQP